MVHHHNRSKWAAIQAGPGFTNRDLVLVQVAAVEDDSDDFPKLLHPILEGKTFVVFGSRCTGERENMLILRWIGSRFLSFATIVHHSATVSEMETCA